MKAVVQRVRRVTISSGDEVLGACGGGLFVLVGLRDGDSERDLEWIASKVARLRVFDDDSGKMNLSIAQAGGTLAVVSEFTLYGDVRRGNRPSYANAMPVEDARGFWPRVEERFGSLGVDCVFGRFQAMMDCEIVNDGPVTLILDSADRRIRR